MLLKGINLLLQALGSLDATLNERTKPLGAFGEVGHFAICLLQSHLALRGGLDLEHVLVGVLDLVNLVEGEPPDAEGGEEGVGLEEHAVLHDGVAGEGLPGGEGRDGHHGPPAVGDLELAHGLAADGAVAEGVVEAEGVEVVVAGDAVLPHVLHVGPVLLAELGADRVETEGGFELGEAKAGKDGGGGEEGDGIEAVEDRGGEVVRSLQHPVGSHELREGPGDDCNHCEAGVTDLGLHHGVQVEGFGKAERVEAIIAGVSAIELAGALEHRHGKRHLHIIVAATIQLV